MRRNVNKDSALVEGREGGMLHTLDGEKEGMCDGKRRRGERAGQDHLASAQRSV